MENILNVDNEVDKGDEENKNRLVQISDLESGKLDISSFENTPPVFCGLDTSFFGSTLKDKNPFFQIKNIAMDKTKSWDDRTCSIRYMQRIPHIDRYKNCIEACKSIVSDSAYPIRDRYHFFSNNIRIIKLDYEIVNAMHVYVYELKESMPLIYKILSAQHILTQFPIGTYDIDGVQTFLKSIATDIEQPINYRAECADILDRAGYGLYKICGSDTIKSLGEVYNDNKKSTIYSNLQNVHDSTITESVIEKLKSIISINKDLDKERNTGEIYEEILDRKGRGKYTELQIDTSIESLQRIVIDTSRYEGLTMHDIMLHVWQSIFNSTHKNSLVDRLIDEFCDMKDTCSSGHLSRIVNILSGYIEFSGSIKISIEDQLKSNIYSRYSAIIRTLSEDNRTMIVDQMINDDDKSFIDEFIYSESLFSELYDEFVPDYLDASTFNTLYYKYEAMYFGKK